MNLNTIIIKPVVTEKALQKSSKGIYTFVVHPKATKYQISQAAEGLFKIKVFSVRTVSRKGKIKRVGKRMQRKNLPDRKIAIITLKEGKIDIFPQP